MDRANDVKGCYWDGGATNPTDTIAFTVQTGGAGGGSGRVDPLPVGWYGEFVEIVSIGADSRFYFTKQAAAVIDPAVAPSAIGAQSVAKGEPLLAGVAKQVLVPTAGPGETVFLVRASVGAPTSLELTKRSGKPGNNTSRD